MIRQRQAACAFQTDHGRYLVDCGMTVLVGMSRFDIDPGSIDAALMKDKGLLEFVTLELRQPTGIAELSVTAFPETAHPHARRYTATASPSGS